MPNLSLEREKGKGTLTVWDVISSEDKKNIFSLSEGYKDFIKNSNTERMVVATGLAMAKEKGFKSLESYKALKSGDKFFTINRNKNIIMGIVGQEPFSRGFQMVAAHSDAPRLDLKPQPLYEESCLTLAKTHYYGGIKKYHWVGIPLALQGVAVREDGTLVEINIGHNPSDPVFTITDLLPHLSKDQMEKKMSEGIPGEKLNIIIGSIPVAEEVEKRFLKSVLQHLDNVYGIKEEDLVSAELEVVPAWPPRDLGFDRSLLGAYGQDDRVCCYTALRALLDMDCPRRTALVLITDKEEVGSTGNTGMMSNFFEHSLAEIMALSGEGEAYSPLKLKRALTLSRALSADVNAGVDPNHEEVMDKYNAARLGCGVVLTKYTGSRGKSGSNDAGPEYLAYIRKTFNAAGVIWQTGELGKVDQGGGGTIAYLMASYNMEVADCGVPVLGMHSPMEVTSKADIYMAYQGFKAFLL